MEGIIERLIYGILGTGMLGGVLWGLRRYLIVKSVKVWNNWKLFFEVKPLLFASSVIYNIGTIEDYIEKLNEIRERIISYLEWRGFEEPCEVYVHVYTKIGPSDWPLWGSNPDDIYKTPLEEYFWKFKREFLENSGNVYEPSTKRVIVVDNYGSDASLHKLKEIEEDMQKDEFEEEYLDYIHVNDSDARILVHEKPWPMELSDVTFYGVQRPNKGNVEWLLAVSTSYQRSEPDLFSIKIRNIGNEEMERLPLGADSLKRLAKIAQDDEASKIYVLNEENIDYLIGKIENGNGTNTRT